MISIVNPFDNPAITFQASLGWLSRFLDRFNLVIRRISSSGHDLPKNCSDIVYNYLRSVNQNIFGKQYAPNEIIYFDEISIYTDMLENHNSKKLAKPKISGQIRLSCLLSSTLDGQKLPIVIIVPKEIKLENFSPNQQVMIIYEESGRLWGSYFQSQLF
jgi:hypothetical protein